MPKKQTKSTQSNPNSIMEKLMSGKTVKAPVFTKNAEIDAKVVSVAKNHIMFNIGGKALAVLGDRETKEISTYMPYLKVDEVVKVRLIAPESKEGYPVVSLSKFFNNGKWKILHDKKASEEAIDVMCGEYGKGGLFIDFMGVRGVIPKIQLLPEHMAEPAKLVGKKIKVKVLEVDEVKNRLVVSEKAVSSKMTAKDMQKEYAEIQPGSTYDASVLGTSEFGIFCDVNGIEGLIHISEISWEKVTNANLFVKPGQKIKVYIVEKNPNDMKLNLSIKRLSGDPWTGIEDKYPKDKLFEGEIIRKERYGYFVRLSPGIEGLIHISKVKNADSLTLGTKVQVYVERINTAERRMSLVLPDSAKPVMYR